jgi:hypothetical protein
MRFFLAATLLFTFACKKEQQSAGLAPAKDWNAGSASDPLVSVPPPNPHTTVDPAAPNPHGGMMGAPSDTPAKALEKQADGSYVMGPFTFAAPADWKVKPLASSMRAADFELTAEPGQDAELIVYYFGEGGAGSVEDNLNRWLGQFTQADGKPSQSVAKIEKTKVAGQDATTVSVSGHYAAMAMPGGSAVDKQDQAMLAAIVASPSGPYYFKLVGAKKTIDANAAKWKALLASLKVR